MLTLTLIGSPSAAAATGARSTPMASSEASSGEGAGSTWLLDPVLKLVNRVLRGMVKIWQTRRPAGLAPASCARRGRSATPRHAGGCSVKSNSNSSTALIVICQIGLAARSVAGLD